MQFPEFVNTPSGTKYVGSKFKSYGQPTFFGDLFSGGASGYRGTQGTGTGPFGNRFFAGSPISLRGTRLKNGQILGGEYFSENEDVGDIKSSLGERISNMGIVGLVKSLFKKDPKDMTESNKYGLGGSKDYIPAGTLDFDPNAQINNINTTVPDNSLALQSFYDNQKPPANITGLTSDITSNQINEFGDGRIGNINDEFGQSPEFNVSQINEFGESPEFNASQINEFGQSPEFNAGLVNEFATSPQFRTSLIDEFGDNRNINMDEFATQNNIDNRLMQEYLTDQAGFQQPITASQIDEFGDNRNINMNEFAGNDIQMQNYLNDQANYNADPLGNPNFDPRVVSEEYGLVGNNTLPGNDTFAFAPGSIKDGQIKQAYDIYKETGFGKSNLEKLMQQDIESGEQLSLDKNAYSLIG